MRILSLTIALLFAMAVNGQNVARKMKAANGVQIGFYEFKPRDYGSAKKQPLIIFLHGVGERGNGGSELPRVARVGIAKMIKNGNPMRFTYKGRTESFVVLSPQLARKYGNWQPFYIEAMIDYAKKHLDIDPNRIFITGLSLGGGGVWKFATASQKNAYEVAGIAPICGTCSMQNPKYVAQAGVGVWAFHAKDDKRVGYTCTSHSVDLINSLRPKSKARKTLFASGGHAIWDRVYNPNNRIGGLNLYEWFLSLKKGNSSSSANYSGKPPVIKKPSKPKPVRKPSRPVRKNWSPYAIAADRTISVDLSKNSTAVLDGTKSYDRDGKIISFRWSRLNGPHPIHFANALRSKTAIYGMAPGVYTLQLEVKDDDGAKDNVIVRVTVRR